MDGVGFSRHGAISRREAEARLGRYEVRRTLAAGVWVSPWSGVLLDADRAAEPLALASAAVILGGPDVVLAGPSAAHLHGLRTPSPTPIHLMAPYGHWLRSRPGLVAHNGPLPSEDRDAVQDLPVLGFERAVTDLVCIARPAEALAVLDEALAAIPMGERERFRAEIGRRLAERRDPRGTRRGSQLLGLATGRAESPAESRLLWRIVDAGFPVPEVNWILVGCDGNQVYRLDLAWPDLRIAVEYDGHAAHAGRAEADDVRAEDLRRRGWLLVRLRADDLIAPAGFESELDQAFRRRGVDTSRRRPGSLRGRRHREPASV